MAFKYTFSHNYNTLKEAKVNEIDSVVITIAMGDNWYLCKGFQNYCLVFIVTPLAMRNIPVWVISLM